MSIFDILEDRMQRLFEGNRMATPLPFKKLAKIAIHEMKRNSVKVDGRKLAPTLYSVLVNEADDAAMAPLYPQVTSELVDFISHEAEAGGYVMIDTPIVRFIVEPTLAPGKLDVMGEVAPADALAEIRLEEEEYLSSHLRALGKSTAGVAAAIRGSQGNGNSRAVPINRLTPRSKGGPAVAVAEEAGIVPDIAPAPAAPVVAPPRNASAVCELSDDKGGQSWRITSERTLVGREGSNADILLSDTNVSRRHAVITRTEQCWHISDLGSTNGTRVNGQRIQEADLFSGDVLTFGLTELSFREL